VPPANAPATISELRAFVSAVDLGSVGRAAARLGLTQPSLSKRLQSLEDVAGVRLLHRSSAGVEPTTAGQRLLPAARRLVAQADVVDGVLLHLGEEREPLRVSASPAFAELVVPAAIASFAPDGRTRPIELTVANSSVVRSNVAGGRADVGVAAADVDEDLAGDGHLLLLEDEIVVVVPPGDPWEALEAIPVGELARRGLVGRDPGAQIRGTIDRGLAGLGLTLAQPVLEAGSPAAVKATVRARGVPGLLSRYAVDEARDGLTVRRISGVELRRRCWALVGPGADPAARTFAEHLRASAAGEAAAPAEA
jgi:DNA-binding transcriptional LysR family regulator